MKMLLMFIYIESTDTFRLLLTRSSFQGQTSSNSGKMGLATKMTAATSLAVPKQASLDFQPIDWGREKFSAGNFLKHNRGICLVVGIAGSTGKQGSLPASAESKLIR